MKDTDRLIQSKLKDFEVDVPAVVWAEIARQLPDTKTRKPQLWLYVRYAVAVILLVLCSVSVFLLTPDETTIVAQQEIESLSPKKGKTSQDIFDKQDINDVNVSPQIDEETSENRLSTETDNTLIIAQEIAIIDSTAQANFAKSSSDSKNADTQEKRSSLNKPLVAQHRSSISNTIGSHKSKNGENNRFSLGIIASNAISSTQYTPDTRRTRSNIYYAEYADELLKYQHKVPISIGVTAEKQFGKHWGLETGLIYTLLRSDYKTESLIREGRQELHYLGVPMFARYRFLNTRYFSFYASAGPQMDFNIYGRRTDRSESSDASSTYTENIRESRVQWSAHLKLGVSYVISRYFDIYAEPAVAYYFNNGNGNIANLWKDKPFNFSFHLGFRTKF